MDRSKYKNERCMSIFMRISSPAGTKIKFPLVYNAYLRKWFLNVFSSCKASNSCILKIKKKMQIESVINVKKNLENIILLLFLIFYEEVFFNRRLLVATKKL